MKKSLQNELAKIRDALQECVDALNHIAENKSLGDAEDGIGEAIEAAEQAIEALNNEVPMEAEP
ncbi:MAG: hypothetical protein L0Z50_12850 [Verrucomicrobiales bacterium]|nr:hypothetical protein [Verrucomicrobiales bacterium]